MHEERRRSSTKQDKLPDPQVSPVLYDRGHMATTYVENRHWMCCPASFVMSISQLRKMCNISVFLQVFVFGVTHKWLARIHCQPLLTRLPLRGCQVSEGAGAA
ncbi:unnamed protein product [Sphagnum compactum]